MHSCAGVPVVLLRVQELRAAAAKQYTRIGPDDIVISAPEEGTCSPHGHVHTHTHIHGRTHAHTNTDAFLCTWPCLLTYRSSCARLCSAVCICVCVRVCVCVCVCVMCCVCVCHAGIYLAMRALLRPNDHVIVTFPGYQSLYEIAVSIGCKVTRWEPQLDPTTAAVRFDVSQLTELMTRDTRLVVCNFPHK